MKPNSVWVEQPLLKLIFMIPKPVQATEDLLYLVLISVNTFHTSTLFIHAIKHDFPLPTMTNDPEHLYKSHNIQLKYLLYLVLMSVNTFHTSTLFIQLSNMIFPSLQ